MWVRYFAAVTILIFISMPTIVTAEFESVDMSPPTIFNPNMRRPLTEDQSIEEIEAYFFEEVYSDAFSLNKMSILSEEEIKELGMSLDTSMEEEILKKEFAKLLAKRDILKLKDKLLRRKTIK